MRLAGWFPPRRGWPASCAGVRPVVPGPAQGPPARPVPGKTFFAALASAWSSWPQATHRNTAWLSRLADATWPHVRHCCDEYFGST
jgi:hypothetical protein